MTRRDEHGVDGVDDPIRRAYDRAAAECAPSTVCKCGHVRDDHADGARGPEDCWHGGCTCRAFERVEPDVEPLREDVERVYLPSGAVVIAPRTTLDKLRRNAECLPAPDPNAIGAYFCDQLAKARAAARQGAPDAEPAGWLDVPRPPPNSRCVIPFFAPDGEPAGTIVQSTQSPTTYLPAWRVYIASGLERAAEVRALRDALAEYGVGLSYDWTAHGSVQDDGPARIAEVGHAEAVGVAEAEAVIVYLPGGRGTHAELGIAIGLNIARAATGEPMIPIFVHGDRCGADGRECAFYYAPGVVRIDGPYSGDSARDAADQRAMIVRRVVQALRAHGKLSNKGRAT